MPAAAAETTWMRDGKADIKQVRESGWENVGSQVRNDTEFARVTAVTRRPVTFIALATPSNVSGGPRFIIIIRSWRGMKDVARRDVRALSRVPPATYVR